VPAEKIAEHAAKAHVEKREESYGFAHPAVSRPQRIVWIPEDTLELTKEEESGCKDAGVRVSRVNAVMDGMGKVEINDGGPPDMIWSLESPHRKYSRHRLQRHKSWLQAL
jgi:Extracellular tail, of 10TM putative phosphate transporter